MSSPPPQSSKASQLMSFLDEVETEIDEDVASTIAGSNTNEYNDDDSMSIISSHTFSSHHTHNTIFHDVKQKMISLKVQLDDKTKTAELLEITLKKAQQKQQDIIQKNKKQLKTQLNRQKKEHQIVTNRHLLFVDRLLNDKENLSKHCEDLTGEIKKLEQECKDKMNKLQVEHKKQMKKAKNEWIASQQIKREQWVANKTKQIKSMTIKGLEPEIQRLIEGNKKDLQLKEDEYVESLRVEKESIYKIFEDKFDDFRIKLNAEKAKEIESIKEKNMKEIQRINQLKETQLNEQMTRLKTQYNEERERHTLLNEKNMNMMIERHKEEISKLKLLHSKSIENINKKHEIEMNKLSQKYRIEKEEWIAIMNKKYNKEYKEKEIEMMTLMKHQQQDEIEVIIDKLSNEYTGKINEIQSKNDRNIDEYKQEIKEERKKCKQWMKQIEIMKEDIKSNETKYQSEIKEIQKMCSDKSKEIEEKNKDIIAVRNEMKTIKEEKDKQLLVLRDENQNKSENICDLERELRECKEKLNALHDELKSGHIMEIENIETRVRQTLCRKDEFISQLKEQIESKNIRIQQIENLLDQQRNELFEQLH